MKVTLIEPRSPGFHVFSIVKLPRLGLPLIGTLLKNRGHDVEVFVEELEEIDMERIRSSDLVGFSTTTSTVSRAYQLAEQFRERFPKLRIVMGGPHVSFLPGEALEYADYCVLGEGEQATLDLVAALEEGREPVNIPGMVSCRDSDPDLSLAPPADLGSLPFPDLSLIRGHEQMSLKPMATSRGCPYGCRFCSVIRMFGRRYRFRPVEDVLRELEKMAPAKVFFYDDNFAARPDRTRRLLSGIIERDIDIVWGAQVRADIARDPRLLKDMYRAGGRILYIGFESVNPKTLKEYEKQLTREKMVEAIERIHKHRLRIHGMFVIGGKNDDIQTIRQTVDFALENRIDTLQLMALIPLPGTPYYEELAEKDRLITSKWQYYDGHHVVYRPEQMSAFTLQNHLIRGMVRFYSLRKCMRLASRLDFANLYYRFRGWRTVKKWLIDTKTQTYLSFLKKNYSH